ncbi:MAG: tetratricopeptide repeat protein [Microcoleaceae cyanobacterium]
MHTNLINLNKYLDEAKHLKKEGKLDQAAIKCRKALQIDQNYTPALNQLAGIYEQESELAQAILCYEKIFTINPQDSKVYKKLVKLLTHQGELAQVITVYQNIITTSEPTAQIYKDFGDTLIKVNQIDEAIAAYEKAVELDSGFPRLYQELAKAYSIKAQYSAQHNKFDQAISAYRKAIALPTVPTVVYKQLSSFLLKNSNLLESIEIYWEALEVNSTYKSEEEQLEGLHSHLGRVIIQLAIKQAQLEQAEICFKKVYNRKNTYFWCNYLLGNTLAKQDKLEEAKFFYEKALQLKPDFYQANLELGKLFVKQEQWEKAFDHHIKAIQIRPKFHEAHKYWLVCFKKFSETDNIDRLEAQIKKYQKNTDKIQLSQLDLIDVYLNISKASVRSGHLQEAIEYNQKATYLLTKNTQPEYVQQYWKRGKLQGPNFLIIGVMKCGTTALYDYIIQHPKVISSVVKEINTDGLAQKSQKFKINRDYYLSFFPPIPENSDYITGEASPTYIHVSNTPKLVSNYFPHAKIMVILRNPVKRLISQYHFFVKKSKEMRSLEQILESEFKILSKEKDFHKITDEYARTNRWFLAHGLYVYFLEKWMSIIPKEQFLIVKSEDLSQSPATVMSQVFQFLDVPEYDSIQFPQKNKGTYSSKINPDLLARLQDFYRPHNQRLEEFLGRKFDWD